MVHNAADVNVTRKREKFIERYLVVRVGTFRCGELMVKATGDESIVLSVAVIPASANEITVRCHSRRSPVLTRELIVNRAVNSPSFTIRRWWPIDFPWIEQRTPLCVQFHRVSSLSLSLSLSTPMAGDGNDE